MYTEHRFRVAETIAGWVPADPQQKHDEMLVLQHAGEVERDGARVKIADEVPLSPGAEYVLFLTWNPGYERFELSRGPFAIFKVENGAVHHASDYRTVKGAKGKAVRRFADGLRPRAKTMVRQGGSREADSEAGG